ncbi:MAG: D-alanyl-D-alanine carboxypeptidase [Alphaproteobacteria bacterium]|nr:D-alanyl-D-alanine carboxypeptidase [Alphaproteobacteria bacterium]
MKNLNKSIIFTPLFCLSLLSVHSASALETKAKNAILMDFETGQFFYEKNADVEMPPASMSKLMTAYLVFERLKNGSLSLDEKFTVSKNAWQKGGFKSGSSTMALEPNQKVKVRDLLRGIIVVSGNDACIVAAENIAGSEENFAKLANQKAEELGLTHSKFANATGWPDPNQKMSAKDLAKLAYRIIMDFPEYYSIYSEQEFKYNNIVQQNRNPLLISMPDIADGMKTGHTSVSGFGLVGSAKKDNRRLIMVVNGLQSMRERSEESQKIMNWGFRNFDNYTIIEAGKKITTIPVWFGEKKNVAVQTKENIVITLERGKQKGISAVIKYKKPVKAPLKIGTQVGAIQVMLDDKVQQELPIYAAENIKKIGKLGQLKEVLKNFIIQIFK